MDAPRDTGSDVGRPRRARQPRTVGRGEPGLPFAGGHAVRRVAAGRRHRLGRGRVGIARDRRALRAGAVGRRRCCPATRRRCSGCWASGPSDVWAVGIDGTVLHFDGGPTGLWTAVPISGTQPTATLTGVWGASSTDVWIVGRGRPHPARQRQRRRGRAVRTRPRIWRASGVCPRRACGRSRRRRRCCGENADRLGGPDGDARPRTSIYGIWLAATNDGWIAGDRATLHNDGAAWTTVANPLDVRDQHLGQRQRRRLVGRAARSPAARRSSPGSTACSGSRRRARPRCPCRRSAERRRRTSGPSAAAAPCSAFRFPEPGRRRSACSGPVPVRTKPAAGTFTSGRRCATSSNLARRGPPRSGW